MAEASIENDLIVLAVNTEADFAMCLAICLAVSRLAEIYRLGPDGDGVVMLMEDLEDRLRERSHTVRKVKRIAAQAPPLVPISTARRPRGARPQLKLVELDQAP
jgi:hypothetical protein